MRPALGLTQVKVVMTRAAADLVGTRVLAAVTSGEVVVDFDDVPDAAAPHVFLAQWADVMLIVPATANFLGKVANGIADDLLTTTVLAASCPVVIVPVTNGVMWTKPAVRRNVAQLRSDGYDVVEPKTGVSLAEGRPDAGSLGDFRPAVVAAVAKVLSGSARKTTSDDMPPEPASDDEAASSARPDSTYLHTDDRAARNQPSATARIDGDP